MNHRIEPTFGSADPPPLPPRAGGGSPRPKSGLSGCVIALIVCGALAVPVLGILTAIAVPAYQDYVVRAKLVGASNAALALQPAIDRGIAALGACPRNGQAGIGAATSYAQRSIDSVAVGAFAGERCGYVMVLRGFGNPDLDGKTLRWQRAMNGQDGVWRCSSDIPPKYLPIACRER